MYYGSCKYNFVLHVGWTRYGCGYKFDDRVKEYRKKYTEEITMNGCFDTIQNDKRTCVCDSDGCTSPYSIVLQEDKEKDTNGSILKEVSVVLFSLVAMRFAF